MELLQPQESSPYLNDLDYVHASPASAQHNISPHTSPFDSFEFGNLQNSNFAHTPSYNGSYHNSPYSNHSELSFGGDNEQYGLFDSEEPIVNGDGYDPSEYDNPANSGGLLMFDTDFMSGGDQGSPHVSVSITPAPLDYQSPQHFDYSSPSSNGGGNSDPDGQARSRGSSLSSNHQRGSPRLDVAQFENLRFESPHWGTQGLPVDRRSITPPHKPQSPPQLVIPGSPNANLYQAPPIINAPDGDGSLGPQLHIVPATPISGGGGQSQPVPFQNTLETLHQGSTGSQRIAPNWDLQAQHLQEQAQLSQMNTASYPEAAQLPFTFPGHSHEGGLSTQNTQVHSNAGGSSYLFPVPTRSRSKSDTDLRPPQWGMNNMASLSQENLHHSNGSLFDDDRHNTVNPGDLLGHHQYNNDPLQSFGNENMSSPQPPHLTHHYTFGPPGTGSSPSNNFLSPDMGIGAGTQLRRSRSDGAPRPGHQRQSRSEDMRHSNAMLYPPSSQQDFISRQFLTPQDSISIRGHGGHARRASSGSRGDGSWSNASSQRPSPYPSPSASPRYNLDELPNVSLSGRQPPLLHDPMMQHDPMMGDPMLAGMGLGDGLQQNMDGPGGPVSKPNVTTGRTANASRQRRKQEANFMCPVPGCGSTFTRSFNLKGHLRSHNEEKPFQCKWPGCGKGFARQHDCKRHEQLHSNYRPFTCEGCSKNFARMDALNRHLRSEGGADCHRMMQEAQGLSLQQSGGQSPPSTKTEDGNNSGWPGMSVML